MTTETRAARAKKNICFNGQRFSRLVVISEAERHQDGHGTQRRVVAQCDCGKINTYYLKKLKEGSTKSCGCWASDNSRAMLSALTADKFPPQEWIIDGECAWANIGGKTVFIDAADVMLVSGTHWFINSSGYAASGNNKPMHRMLLGLHAKGQRRLLGDHKDRDRTNNRRSNLRVATPRQNSQNKAGRSDNRKMWKGYKRAGNKYKPVITVNGVDIRLGSFDSEVDAARTYDAAAIKHFGEFACTNFGVSS